RHERHPDRGEDMPGRAAHWRIEALEHDALLSPEFGEVDEEVALAVGNALPCRTRQLLEGAAVEEQRRGSVRLELLDETDDEQVVAAVVHVLRDAPEVRAALGEMRHAGPHLPLGPRAGLRPA